MSHACITCVCCVMWLNQNTWSQKCVSTYRRRNVFWPRMSDIPSRLNPFQRQTWLIRRNRNEPWLSSDYPNCRSRWNGLVLNPCWHHPPPTTFPGASTERDYYFPSCTFRYKEINVIQSVDERRKGNKAKKINKIQLAILLAVWLASTSRLLRSVQKSWDCAAGPALLERGRWTCSPAARPFVTARTSNRPPSATAQNLCHSELSLDTKSFPKARTHTQTKKKRRQ